MGNYIQLAVFLAFATFATVYAQSQPTNGQTCQTTGQTANYTNSQGGAVSCVCVEKTVIFLKLKTWNCTTTAAPATSTTPGSASSSTTAKPLIPPSNGLPCQTANQTSNTTDSQGNNVYCVCQSKTIIFFPVQEWNCTTTPGASTTTTPSSGASSTTAKPLIPPSNGLPCQTANQTSNTTDSQGNNVYCFCQSKTIIFFPVLEWNCTTTPGNGSTTTTAPDSSSTTAKPLIPPTNGLPCQTANQTSNSTDSQGNNVFCVCQSQTIIFFPVQEWNCTTTPAPTTTTAAPTTQPSTAAPTTAPPTTQPSTAAPTTEPSTAAPTEPSTAAPTEPSTAAPTEASTAAPTEPSTAAPTEASTAAPTEPSTEAPTEASTAASTEAATEAATEATTEASTAAPGF